MLNQEIVVRCPEGIQKTSIAFEAKGGVLGHKIRFPFGRPRAARLMPVKSLQDMSELALLLTDDGFEIDTRGMTKDDIFLLDVEYEVKTEGFVDALVERSAASEFPKDRESEYWMHASLKHPKLLQTKYGRLDLRDVNFDVDVGVSEHIKTVIPNVFRAELELAVKLLAEREPHRKKVLGVAHTIAMRSRGQKSSLPEIMGDLQELFFPTTFGKYVTVTKDFHYAECLRGSNFYDALPFPTWPKTMTVVSRTDLSLDRCAAEGVLV